MCGRFALISDLSDLTDALAVDEVQCEYRPSGNIAPGRDIAAVVFDGRRRLVHLRWGLIPSWARDRQKNRGFINARAETVADKPSFKSAFRKGRCLIAADGFYEWEKQERRKVPHYFQLKGKRPFAFAGLYETWTAPDARQVRTCAIITTEANELIAPIHDRMPVILSRVQQAAWIEPDGDRSRLLSLLTPYPEQDMIATAAPTPSP
ncbi:MAG: SOS response-associated peptidase [Deltaproteobacteria bacterium]|nr:SOS response-associated peptidase [Deltaproteobacteria bacterium]